MSVVKSRQAMPTLNPVTTCCVPIRNQSKAELLVSSYQNISHNFQASKVGFEAWLAVTRSTVSGTLLLAT